MSTHFPAGGVGPGCGPDDDIITVHPAQWRQVVADTLATHPWLESITGVDEVLRPTGSQEEIRVVARFVDPTGPRGRQLHVRVSRDDGALDSVTDLVAGADWYEREVHDMLGVRIGPERSPVLWHPRPEDPVHPLRKDVLLTARVTTPWPGAKDPAEQAGPQASRRRSLPPGVPDPDLVDDQGRLLPGVGRLEVVASLGGGRVRRRR